MPAVFSILRLPAVLGLLLALLVCSGCGQATARQPTRDRAPTTAQVAVEQRAEVIAELPNAEPAVEQSATSPQPLLFADERPEPYCPRGPPGLVVLPFFPAPLILPADLAMSGEVGIVVERVVRDQQVVAWAAISPVGFRFATIQVARFRAYVPGSGRWLSRDPIGERDGLNLYAYVKNRPIVAIDPDGRFLHIIVGAAGGAIGAVITGSITGNLSLGSVVSGAISGAGTAAGGAVGGALGGAVGTWVGAWIDGCEAQFSDYVGNMAGGIVGGQFTRGLDRYGRWGDFWGGMWGGGLGDPLGMIIGTLWKNAEFAGRRLAPQGSGGGSGSGSGSGGGKPCP